MTRVTVTSNENETIAAGEELAQEISKIITDFTIMSALMNRLHKEKSTELPNPTDCDAISASIKNLSH